MHDLPKNTTFETELRKLLINVSAEKIVYTGNSAYIKNDAYTIRVRFASSRTIDDNDCIVLKAINVSTGTAADELWINMAETIGMLKTNHPSFRSTGVRPMIYVPGNSLLPRWNIEEPTEDLWDILRTHVTRYVDLWP